MAVPHDDSWLIFSPEGNSTPTKDRVARKRPIGCRALLFVRQPRRPFFLPHAQLTGARVSRLLTKCKAFWGEQVTVVERTPEHAHIVHVDMYPEKFILDLHGLI